MRDLCEPCVLANVRTGVLNLGLIEAMVPLLGFVIALATAPVVLIEAAIVRRWLGARCDHSWTWFVGASAAANVCGLLGGLALWAAMLWLERTNALTLDERVFALAPAMALIVFGGVIEPPIWMLMRPGCDVRRLIAPVIVANALTDVLINALWIAAVFLGPEPTAWP